MPIEDADVGGIGGTLAGYALSMAAARATLGEVLTDAAFERMIPLAERWERGVDEAIERHGAPWSVTRLGARAEYHFMPDPPRDGADQIAHADSELERLLHLWVMNRGVLMTPFHNMALMSPATTEADVDRHTGGVRRGARRRCSASEPMRGRTPVSSARCPFMAHEAAHLGPRGARARRAIGRAIALFAGVALGSTGHIAAATVASIVGPGAARHRRRSPARPAPRSSSAPPSARSSCRGSWPAAAAAPG